MTSVDEPNPIHDALIETVRAEIAAAKGRDMNRLTVASNDEQFFAVDISVIDTKDGQRIPTPSSDFKLCVTPDGELLATIEMPIPMIDIVAIVSSINLKVEPFAGPNDNVYALNALNLLSETRCPEPKVRLHFPDGVFYSGHVYAAANGEELYGCVTNFDLAVYKPNPERGLYRSALVVNLDMQVSSLDVVLAGLDPDAFVVTRDDLSASISICPVTARESI